MTPTANVQVRFIASDEGEGSVVEAAVDELKVTRTDCVVCQPDLGFGGPGSATLSLCGEPLASGNTADLLVSNAPAAAQVFVGFGSVLNPTPFLGGTLAPNPLTGVIGLTTDGSGEAGLTVSGGPAALTLYVQAVVVEPGTGNLLFTNAVAAEYLP